VLAVDAVDSIPRVGQWAACNNSHCVDLSTWTCLIWHKLVQQPADLNTDVGVGAAHTCGDSRQQRQQWQQ